MNTLEFFNGFISPSCHKIQHNLEEYRKVKENINVHVIKATTFYQFYKHNVFGPDNDRLSMRDFFRICGQYLYYDKCLCYHGTEFYYYVIFNEDDPTYLLLKDFLEKRIAVDGMDTLNDLIKVIPAVTKEYQEVFYGKN